MARVTISAEEKKLQAHAKYLRGKLEAHRYLTDGDGTKEWLQGQLNECTKKLKEFENERNARKNTPFTG